MAPEEKAARPASGAGRTSGRKPTTRHSVRNGRQARVGKRHAALVRLLATFEDPVVTIGLAEGQAVGNSLLVAACRSAGLIVVLQRPDLLREPELLAAEVARLMSALLEVVDGPSEP